MSRPNAFRLSPAAALLTLVVLAAGDAHAIEICGNGICNPNGFPSENYQTCPADCGGNTNPCQTDSCTTCTRPSVGTDLDLDGVPDRLEFDLAHKFFPRVLLQWAGVDRDESYLFEGFAIPYTLRPLPAVAGGPCDELRECVEIRYGIAFFEDHGDIGGAYSHLGDSEMVAAVLRRTASWIEAQNNQNDWQMIRDFTSAHWGESLSESSRIGVYGFCPAECSTMYGDPTACNASTGCSFGGSCTGVHGGCYSQSTYSQCVGTGGCTWNGGCAKASRWTCYDALPKNGHVNVFAAESKHALYHTDSECDGGGILNSDDCPNNSIDMRLVKTNKLQNVGNVSINSAFDTRIKHPNRCNLYNVWGGSAFGEATSYRSNFIAPIDWLLD